jgi:hypothetical protein
MVSLIFNTNTMYPINYDIVSFCERPCKIGLTCCIFFHPIGMMNDVYGRKIRMNKSILDFHEYPL